ncbi:uncharacterized protein LOC128559479 [Mercenaria mercenaria]|uniref:uncharacterized protein LOC128559479 n=1 Tax=Mercenaria mercenaria TaxID=6596 RepID=UPI00234E4164|nr:uncharacterized protein LOC128559479 [Mercenaria mercenaria]
MAKLLCLVVFAVIVVGSSGQLPGMDYMKQIMANIGRIQAMNKAMFMDGLKRARAGRRFGPGETRFRTANGGTGYVYNSPDGTSSSYSFRSSSGGPSHGFTYSFDHGRTFRREW